jgi:hypothetical protein
MFELTFECDFRSLFFALRERIFARKNLLGDFDASAVDSVCSIQVLLPNFDIPFRYSKGTSDTWS